MLIRSLNYSGKEDAVFTEDNECLMKWKHKNEFVMLSSSHRVYNLEGL